MASLALVAAMVDAEDVCKDNRGWAMRRGHSKRLSRETGRESTRGRATFRRSVNSTRRVHWMDDERDDGRRQPVRAGMEEAIAACAGLQVLRLGLQDYHWALQEGGQFDFPDAVGQWSDIEEEEEVLEEEVRKETCDDKSEEWLIVPTVQAGGLDLERYDSYKEEDEEDGVESTAPSEECSSRMESSVSSSWEAILPSKPLTRWECAVNSRQEFERKWKLEVKRLAVIARLAKEAADEEARLEAARAEELAAREEELAARAEERARAEFEALTPYERKRHTFFQEQRSELERVMSSAFGGGLELEFKPFKVSQKVSAGWMDWWSKNPTARLRPVVHGTHHSNYSGISRDGLVIPGRAGVRVVNGSAHGVGIYTAVPSNVQMSLGYACGYQGVLLCGYLEKQGVDQKVKDLNNVVVIFEHDRVIPMFEVGCGVPPPPPPPPLRSAYIPSVRGPGRRGTKRSRYQGMSPSQLPMSQGAASSENRKKRLELVAKRRAKAYASQHRQQLIQHLEVGDGRSVAMTLFLNRHGAVRRQP